jgi:hypothetical protein
MTYTPPTVNYSATHNGTYTTLTGIQSVSLRRGRQRFQEPFSQSICTIELIPANSYALPLAIDQFIDIRDTNSASSPCYFEGQITDVTRTYDLPYNNVSGAAPGDRITVTATGAVGNIGSATLNNFTMYATDNVTNTLFEIGANTKVNVLTESNSILNSGRVYSGPALEAFNKLLQTAQMLVDDQDTARLGDRLGCRAVNNLGRNPLGLSYSDTGATRFESLEYQSSAENTFNYVEVEAEGLTPQVTQAATGRLNSLVYQTYNTDTATALSLSQYLYNLLSGQLAPVPFTIATDTAAAPTCMAAARILTSATGNFPVIGQLATITFRGTTVTGQIQGVSANFYIDRANVQLYFSPSIGVPFTLDSTTNGVLDQNRLGFP